MASPSEPPVGPDTESLVPAKEPCPAFLHRPEYGLARTILAIQSRADNGTLRVEAEGGVVTIIRFSSGVPVSVEGGLPADSLGRLLVKRGHISEATLAKVEEQRMLLQGRLRFGEVAQRLGALDEDTVSRSLREQVRDKLARCLHWEQSQHTFTAEPCDLPPPLGLPLSIEPLLLYGVARHFSLDRTRSLLAASLDERPTLRSNRRTIVVRFQLDDFDQGALDLMLAAPTLRSLLCPQTPEEMRAVQLVAALALTDQLRVSEPEVGPEKSGPFAIDRLLRSREGGAHPESSGLIVTGSQAAGEPQAPQSQLPGKDKLLADSAFLQGKELLRSGEYGAAADAFREASNLRPTALEYALFAAWSAYLSTGRAQKWRQMLIELCDKTLEQDRHLAFAYHVKGQLAVEHKDFATAQAALKRAVELDPNDREARRLLAKIHN